MDELTLDDDLSFAAPDFTPPPKYVRTPRASGTRPWLEVKLNADTVYYYRLSHSTPTHFVYVKSTRLEAAKGGVLDTDPYTAVAVHTSADDPLLPAHLLDALVALRIDPDVSDAAYRAARKCAFNLAAQNSRPLPYDRAWYAWCVQRAARDADDR